MIEKIAVKKPNVAVFGVGHGTYWGQFPGLLETLEGFHKEFVDMVASSTDAEIVAAKAYHNPTPIRVKLDKALKNFEIEE
jgi:hypothetical protein